MMSSLHAHRQKETEKEKKERERLADWSVVVSAWSAEIRVCLSNARYFKRGFQSNGDARNVINAMNAKTALDCVGFPADIARHTNLLRPT